MFMVVVLGFRRGIWGTLLHALRGRSGMAAGATGLTVEPQQPETLGRPPGDAELEEGGAPVISGPPA
jgi:hypothetical protein